jgi:hypothetical protein
MNAKDRQNGKAPDIQQLRVAALEAHRISVGRGDELVHILKNTIRQMEKAHKRVQWMSLALFLAGLVVLGVGVYEVSFSHNGVWGAVLGTAGGITAFVATFLTAPMERISASITHLVRLETAFLGFIRILGEVDSAFQMQYLDIVNDSSRSTLEQVIRDTKNHMIEAMKLTTSLIDVHGSPQDTAPIAAAQAAIDERLQALESSIRANEAAHTQASGGPLR